MSSKFKTLKVIVCISSNLLRSSIVVKATDVGM